MGTLQLYIQLKILFTDKKVVLWETSAPLHMSTSSFRNLKYIYPLIKSKSVIYLRYIGGTVMVWIKSEIELRQFMSEINKKQSIKFDFKFSKKCRISEHISVHRLH